MYILNIQYNDEGGELREEVMGNCSQYRISCMKMACAECKKGIGCI